MEYMQMTRSAIYTSTRWFNTPVMTIVMLWMIFYIEKQERGKVKEEEKKRGTT